MALGVVDTVEKVGKLGEIFIIGIDGNENALQSIREGKLTATLNTNPVEMGRILMRTVIRSKIKGEKISSEVFSPVNITDQNNIDFCSE
jgi:ABC-type sugar transport system substrate-binding protein